MNEVLSFILSGAIGGLVVLLGYKAGWTIELRRKRSLLAQKIGRLEEREKESMLKTLQSVHSSLKLKQEEVDEAQSGLERASDELEEGAIQTRYGPAGPIEEKPNGDYGNSAEG